MNAARLKIIDYALGLLSDDVQRTMDHQRKLDPFLDRTITDIQSLLTSAGITFAGAESTSALVARIMSGLAARAQAQPWHHERAGVAIRTLWDDNTLLFRCTADIPFPAHRHDREERLVVLDGALLMGMRTLATGAFEISPRGSIHDAGMTQQDCLLLIQYGD